jgi:TetR/AcrR family transcriptional regulator
MTVESYPVRQTFLQLAGHKRDRVLRAAMREFADHGFERANLDRIARAARIPKGSLYQYFDHKRACFDAVVQHAFGIAYAELVALLRRNAGDVFDAFRRALLFPVALRRRHPLIADLYFRVGFLEPGELQSAITDRNSLFQDDWFARGIAAGSLRPDLDRAAAGFLLDAVANRVHFLALSQALAPAALRRLAAQQTGLLRLALGTQARITKRTP